jgi:hypothetical protein
LFSCTYSLKIYPEKKKIFSPYIGAYSLFCFTETGKNSIFYKKSDNRPGAQLPREELRYQLLSLINKSPIGLGTQSHAAGLGCNKNFNKVKT